MRNGDYQLAQICATGQSFELRQSGDTTGSGRFRLGCHDLNGTYVVTCGDGNVDAPETCDDGDRLDGDGCSATCQTE